jgi:hypothetical protein
MHKNKGKKFAISNKDTKKGKKLLALFCDK